jgi:hypothetical protein
LSPAQALLNRFAELGAVVEIGDSGRLVVRAVLTPIPKEVVGSARALKAEIIELIQASAATRAYAIPVAAVSDNGARANTSRDIIRQVEHKFVPTVSENGDTSAQSKPDVIHRTEQDHLSRQSLKAIPEIQAAYPPPRDETVLHKGDSVAPLRPTSDEWTSEDWKAFFDERAGILEFDCKLPRPLAETHAFEGGVVAWLDRNPVDSPPGRCVSCGDGDGLEGPPLLSYQQKGNEPAWLHQTCWETWHKGRRTEAVAALLALGISNPADRVPVEIESGGSLLQPVTVIYQEICKPNGPGKIMRVMLGDRELSRGGNPMGDACRRLVSEGHSPDQTIQAYWEESRTPIWAAGTKLKQWTNRSVKKKPGLSGVANVDQVGDQVKVLAGHRFIVPGTS